MIEKTIPIIGVDLIFSAAKEHGERSARHVEVDDLHDAMREAWAIMNPSQRLQLMGSNHLIKRLQQVMPDEDIFESNEQLEASMKEAAVNESFGVSLDGGITYQEAVNGVRIVYRDVPVPGEDESGELHINATSEGLITDIWVSRDGELDHNLGTSSQLIEDIVFDLVDDEPESDSKHESFGE